MKLVLKNICTIENAEIEFNGITVVAGENNTGKSTISRALFSSFYGLSGMIDKIPQTIMDELVYLIRPFGFLGLNRTNQLDLLNSLMDFRVICLENKYVYNELSKNPLVYEKVNEVISKWFVVNEGESNFSDYKDLINNISLVITKDNDYYKKLIINKCIKNEFKDKISSVFSQNKDASIELLFNSDKEKNTILIKENEVKDVIDVTKIMHNILYIDGQDVDYYLQLRDYKQGEELYDHKSVMDLFINFTFANDKNSTSENDISIFSDFNGMGEVFVDKGKTHYKTEYFNEAIDPAQISQGLKSIIILRQLYINGYIKKKSFIILDEPEINLHPKWQIYLAKLLCEFNKKMDVHIMLCSHSPYFISAIMEYSKNKKIEDRCNYYLTKNDRTTHVNSVNNCSSTPKKIFSTLYESVIDLRDINAHE